MVFNPDPTKQATEVLFSCKKMKSNHPQLMFNGTAVTEVNEQKHLGLIFESDLSFDKHLNERMKEGKKNIGILKAPFQMFTLIKCTNLLFALILITVTSYTSFPLIPNNIKTRIMLVSV